jgi:flagellar basal-body rod modification protein FlgD
VTGKEKDMSTTTNTSTGAPAIYTPTTTTNMGGTANASTAGGALGENSFLQLMVTELQNQDPTSPIDDTEYVSELAQFSSLQQMTNLNTTATSQSALSQMSTAAGLIGATVTSSQTNSAGTAISGVVSSASLTTDSSGTQSVTLDVGGTSVPLTSVTQISPTSASSS